MELTLVASPTATPESLVDTVVVAVSVAESRVLAVVAFCDNNTLVEVDTLDDISISLLSAT